MLRHEPLDQVGLVGQAGQRLVDREQPDVFSRELRGRACCRAAPPPARTRGACMVFCRSSSSGVKPVAGDRARPRRRAPPALARSGSRGAPRSRMAASPVRTTRPCVALAPTGAASSAAGRRRSAACDSIAAASRVDDLPPVLADACVRSRRRPFRVDGDRGARRLLVSHHAVLRAGLRRARRNDGRDSGAFAAGMTPRSACGSGPASRADRSRRRRSTAIRSGRYQVV